MIKKELAFKILQGIMVVVITAFFLLPYVRAGSTLYESFNLSSQKEKTISPRPNIHADDRWSKKPVVYTPDNLGINFPWLGLHNGIEAVNWLNTKYNSVFIEKDLAEIEKMGITKIRAFCQMESLFNYKHGEFVLNERYAKNLDDFLNRAAKHNLLVICVMGDGNYEGTPQDLDGLIRWDLIQKPEGLQVYKNAYISYINRFKNHKNILMWDMINEPYGSITWSFSAKALKVTPVQVHNFLLQSYKAIKSVAFDTLVGFSDVEEEQQSMYQLFSDPQKRKALVDDCTDVYAMHIYRATPSEVADFRELSGKPKWVLELGSYNYYDPDAKEHPLPAASELYDTEENYIAVTQILPKLLNSGFTLIMPWSFSSNSGMIIQNPDGSIKLLKLAQFMKDQLLSYKAAHEATPTVLKK